MILGALSKLLVVVVVVVIVGGGGVMFVSSESNINPVVGRER